MGHRRRQKDVQVAKRRHHFTVLDLVVARRPRSLVINGQKLVNSRHEVTHQFGLQLTGNIMMNVFNNNMNKWYTRHNGRDNTPTYFFS
jgi:hypothetical protein